MKHFLKSYKLRRNHSLLFYTTAVLAFATMVNSASFVCSAHANEQSLIKHAADNTLEDKDSLAIEGPGFLISVDGDQVAGGGFAEDPLAGRSQNRKSTSDAEKVVQVVQQRETDLGLEAVDIQVKFDGLGVEPILNVSTTDLRHSYLAGQRVEFVASSNYPDWVERSEIRIFERGNEPRPGLQGGFENGKPLSVLTVSGSRSSWIMPESGTGDYAYVLRVYDSKGRYDETVPLGLSRTEFDLAPHETSPSEVPVSAGEVEDRTNVRNIPVYGGAVTVYGRNVPPGYTVDTLGERVKLDNDNQFVIQRILPPGDHLVEVDVNGAKDGQLSFHREIHVPRDEWFYVGLADVTIGRHSGDQHLLASASGEYDETYTRGQLTFYLKGKIKGEYLLTAAADSGEEELEDLFSNNDAKDPRSLLRRIDPDDYYPIYGDDSTIVEDAPTKGNFYVRLEKGESHALWGNYKTEITGTEFARMERGLYGAHVVLKSEKVTAYGEPIAEVEAYAAEPDTLPQRDVLRGTGGSVYFLTRQDLVKGSETLTVEVRDAASGLVRSRKQLRYNEDYEIDYVQGVVILRSPLSSTADSSTLVSEGALGDDIVNLVAQYEFTPTFGEIDGYSSGGRAQVWLNDNLRVGVSGISEKTGDADQSIVEADVKVRIGENSYIRGEIAESEGPGFGRSKSINGGLSILDTPSSGVTDREARAYRGELHVDVSDIDPDKKGVIGGYYERREAGFSSLDYETPVGQRSWGAFADIEVDETLRYRLGYEEFQDDDDRLNREVDAKVEFALDPHWQLAIGGKHFDIKSPGEVKSNGRRTDVAARVTYEPHEDYKAYVFGQATIERSGDIERNDRVGIGASFRVTEKVSLDGEVSLGTTGWGAEGGIAYDPTADDHYYVGYRYDPDDTRLGTSPINGRSQSAIIAGTRHRYDDLWSVFLENSYDLTGSSRSLTSAYGVTYTPNALWTVDGSIEYGDVEDTTLGELERVAVSAGVLYNEAELLNWDLKAEMRFEDSAQLGLDRDTYLFSGGMVYRQSDDWRLLLHADFALSDSDQASFLDGDYIEASFGYAYRPIDNDRLNALFKYNFLYDLPGPDQVTVQGTTLGPAQRTHILSADIIYDLNEQWSLGTKYGFRIGETSITRSASDFVRSSAHLGVLRFDWHVVKNWDLTAEARILHTPEVDTTAIGAVAVVHRHIGDNFKVGVGYNFNDFSDDLSDLTRDDEGVFINLVGKI